VRTIGGIVGRFADVRGFISQARAEETGMAKFVLIFHAGETPEVPSAEVMDRWMAWFGELGAAVVDMGAPFVAAGDHRVRWDPERRRRSRPGDWLHRDRGSKSSRRRRHGQGMPWAEQRWFAQAVRDEADGLTAPGSD